MLPLLWQPLSTEAVILVVTAMARFVGWAEELEPDGSLPWGRGGGFSRAQWGSGQPDLVNKATLQAGYFWKMRSVCLLQ